jgi:uncharacterized membrane protein
MAAAPINPPGPPEIALVCPQCQSSMPASASFCPGCGYAIKGIPLADRAIAALAYLTFLPAAGVLLLPAYRQRAFVRFHAWQSVLLWGAFCLLTIVALFLSNLAATLEFLLFGILAVLAMFFLWVVLSVKAWQGERFELPIFGMLAGRLR